MREAGLIYRTVNTKINIDYEILVTPPSTTTSCPVIYELASLARNTHAPMISSGSAIRPLIVSVFQPSSRCENAAVISVRTYPGLIVLTRMPYHILIYS